MIRQQAFIDKNKMLKGALHCHTTRSDGKCTPKETVELYKAKGYDFISITDHHIYNFENPFPQSNITVLPGIENNTTHLKPEVAGLCVFHVLALGPTKEAGNGYEQDEDTGNVDVRNSEEYQPYIDDMHAKNNITIYCHPEWSGTPASLFETQRGHTALEIWNTISALAGDDTNAAYWDDLLANGDRIYGVATDDMHRESGIGGGWIMVNAKNNINDIFSAIKDGKFYSSTGPEIYDFYVNDNGIAILDCSAVKEVYLHSAYHPNRAVRHSTDDMTHIEFDLINGWPNHYDYIRISIVDKDGNRAWTNPIFFEETLK